LRRYDLVIVERQLCNLSLGELERARGLRQRCVAVVGGKKLVELV
jgi:hypothetical protein